MTYEVIPYSVYQHPDGRKASMSGAWPGIGWTVKDAGWTVRNTRTGRTGIGRQPWETEVEAQTWANKENARLSAPILTNP